MKRKRISELLQIAAVAIEAAKLGGGDWYAAGDHLYDGNGNDITIRADSDALIAIYRVYAAVAREFAGSPR